MIGNQHLYFDQPVTPSISPCICFYPFAEGAVLHWRQTHRLWVLNSPAAYLWCLLEEGVATEALAPQLVKRFATDVETAERDVALTLQAFADEGLLGSGSWPQTGEEENPWSAAWSSGQLLQEPAQWAMTGVFQTPHQTVEFRCQDPAIGVEFADLCAHLQGAGGEKGAIRLAVLADLQTPERWEIYLDGRLFHAGLARGEVLPHLFTLIFVKGSAALHDFLLFHAAVIGGREQVLLLPAEAGAGKTTLVATLAARGHRFLADELAVLDRRALKLLPMPMPMSIKPGSLPILERYYPGLSAKPAHPRADGQTVRYLTPATTAIGGPDRCATTIEALIFPQYQAGARTSLLPLDKISALQRLVHTGSSDRELLPADIEALIGMVEKHPCYALEYADLDEVLQLLESTFACLRKDAAKPS